MTITWITPAGTLQNPITERIYISIALQATSNTGNVTYTLIAGNLPRGLRLEQGIIRGSPTEVRKYTESRFVIRAEDGSDIEDRTFSLAVDGSDAPMWITKEGFLNVGQGENYFVLDNSWVDFQLAAHDNDEIVGDKLEYRLISNGGELPPGLTLSKTGRIYGFTDPVFAIDVDTLGGYDTVAYDITYFDKPKAGSIGYDSYLYDTETFDYSESTRVPKRLSRFYTFVVAVSDGIHSVNRLFRIWVVTDEFLKSDNSIVQVDTNLFRADNISNRIPIWITESNLGTFRADNYLTIYLDVYDPPTLSGTIIYLLLPTNPNGSKSELPPGMTLDTVTGEIAGRVRYQSRVRKTYTFTLQAIDFPASLDNTVYDLQGDWSNSIKYYKNQAVRYQGQIYICVNEHTNQLPSVIDSIYWLPSVASAEKTFYLELIGEIDSTLSWITESDLGTIIANQPSLKYIEASSTIDQGQIVYQLTNDSGPLPPGLELLGTGSIVGKVRQFADNSGANGEFRSGLTRFYENIDNSDLSISKNFDTLFDNNTTTFDKLFKFKVKARDIINSSELIKEFTIRVIADNTKTFANLYLKAFQKQEKRLEWHNFITDNNLFRPSEIYRYGDKNFGVQNELKILVYGGIESVAAVKYVQAMSRNHYLKQLKFGDLRYAKAKDPDTQETVYEVVYIEVIDDHARGNVSIAQEIQLPDNINSKILTSYESIHVDSDVPLVSDSDRQRVFPNSIKNMRRRIKSAGARDRTFLPLWMRSIQDQNFVETGYVAALVLCYVKPGLAEKVISRIKSHTEYASRGIWSNTITYRSTDSVLYKGAYYSAIIENINKLPDKESSVWIKNFNFKNIDFTADRYLIDILDSQMQDKYLAFPQRGEKLP